MKLIKTGKKKWANEHQTFIEKIKNLYIVANEPSLGALAAYKDTTNGIAKIIGEAAQSNTSIRPLGAGWSWTKIATVKDGIMIDTKPLNIIMSVSAEGVSPQYAGDQQKLVFAQCGNGIWELNRELRKRNLSLKTCGASNGQTIVGAMSTGAHGSTIDVGGVQDYIVGMHIIVSKDRHVWVERKSYPVVSDAFITNMETELLREDDDLFNAALVSFGSFGFIHGVMMETEDLYLLETNRQHMPYDNLLKNVMKTLDFSGLNLPNGDRPFHFGVNINPYDPGKRASVTLFYKRPYREDYVRPVKNDAGLGPGDDAPCFIGQLTDVLPRLVPQAVNLFINNREKPFSNQFGTLGEIFNNTDIRGKVMSTAIGIPLDVVTQVTDLILAVNKTDGPFLGIFSYRFIKKSEATLAFTHFGDFTCILELDGVLSNKTKKFYKAVWDKLHDEGIPFTFHWGKETLLDPEKIAFMYGEDAELWIAARNKLLDADGMKVFTNPLLKEWGLDKVVDIV